MTDFSARRVMMVDTQVRPSDVTKFPIIAALLAVAREAFVPPALVEAAYMGGNLDLAPGRVMVESRTLAKMLEYLNIQPGDRVLNLACGFGYTAAVLSHMGARVVAVDDDADLAAGATSRIAAQGLSGVQFKCGDLKQGATETFDVIVIEGGVETIDASVLAQLAEGGRIGAIFMSGALGTVRIGTKMGGQVSWRFAFNATAPVLSAFAQSKAFAL